MESLPKTDQLLSRISFREGVKRLAKRWWWSTLILGGVYLVAMLVSRLLGVIPNWFCLISWSSLPVGSLLLALIFHRKTPPETSAKITDHHSDSSDLFLTATQLKSSAGDYQTLVTRDAEKKAEDINASEVVPWHWWRPLGWVAGAMGLLLLGVYFLPQLDPFGNEKDRMRTVERFERVEETKKATTARAEALKEKDQTERAAAIQASIDELEQTFKNAKPEIKDKTAKSLSKNQQDLAKFWRALSDEKLRDLLSEKQKNQGFGQINSNKMDEFKESLKKGDLSEAKKRLEDVQKMAKKLEGMENSPEKRQLQSEIREKMQELKEAMAEGMNSKALNQAMARAADQLDMSSMDEVSKEALQGLQDSLELSEQELENLAQNMKDLESLEEALSAAQMAKHLNEMGKLGESQPGQGSGEAEVKDYAELYEEMMAQAGQGGGQAGEGMQGPGIGAGGEAPEDDTLKSDFKTEKSRSALAGGKILMQWKSKGVAEPGEAREEYLSSIDKLKEGVSEAIRQDEVPPGYHDGIQGYFDSIETVMDEGVD